MHTASYLQEIGTQGSLAGSEPRSKVRLPDLSTKRLARGATLAANAVPLASMPPASLASDNAAGNNSEQETTPALGSSPAGRVMGSDWFHSVSTRMLAFHAVLMRPKIWLSCVAALTLVILITWLCHTPPESTPIISTQPAKNVSTSNVAQHSIDPPARIVALPAETEPEQAHSTALDSHSSSPGLQPASEVRVAERGDAARYDGAAGPEAVQPDAMGATLQEIEPVSESTLATPQGASQP